MALTLARLGWEFVSPFVIRDTRGVEHTLTCTSPCLVRDLMRDATGESLEKKIGTSFAKRTPVFDGRRACLDLAINASRPTKGITRQQSAAFRAVACGAVWTAAQAKERGYLTDGLCDKCRAAPDTVRHRVYECEATRETVKASVPRWFWEEAARNGAFSPFWTTAIIPHPSTLPPDPAMTYTAKLSIIPKRGGLGQPMPTD